ncbi:hypothetical protein COOONC_01932 [Cooperia oncophora]
MGRTLLLIVTIPLLASCHVLSRLADFQDIVRQRKNGNSIAQCPCVLHAESGRCIVYNSRYQAANVEEAMLAFHDLTSRYEPAPERDAVTLSCRTLECQHCFGLLYYRLLDLGVIDSDFRTVTPVLERSALRPSLCPRYRFLLDPKVPPVPTSIPPYIQSTIEAGLRNAGKLPQNGDSTQQGGSQTGEFGQQYVEGRFTYHESRRQGQWQSSQRGSSYQSNTFVPSSSGGFGGYGKRKRRAAKQALVGSRFIIGCSNRGESEDNMLALCGTLMFC